jgi:intracellular multiplication protein IcmK
MFCLEASTALAEQTTKTQAYNEILQNNMALSPSQIEQIKRMQEERQEAIIGRPAKVRVRTITLNVAPGMAPEKIITLPGYATSLSFFDQTGAIWPVKKARPGNPKAFYIEEPEEKNSDPINTVTASCIANNGHSNLTVELSGMDLPIMFPLVMAPSHKKKPTIDGIVIVRIKSFGPMAKPPVVEPRPADPVSDDLISFLDGISPNGAQRADIEPPNKNITVWKKADQLFLRTSNPVLWPAWTAAVRGPGGTRVYEMPNVTSILASSDGQITRYTIKSKTGKK